MRFSIRFGTTKNVRDKWDGKYPVNLHRVFVIDGKQEESGWPSRCMKASTLDRAIARCGEGRRYNQTDSWVELRNPKSRSRK